MRVRTKKEGNENGEQHNKRRKRLQTGEKKGGKISDVPERTSYQDTKKAGRASSSSSTRQKLMPEKKKKLERTEGSWKKGNQIPLATSPCAP